MNRIDPKGKPWTPEQEGRLKQAEILFASARIIERGVAAFLNSGEYANDTEMDQASEMLKTACVERKQARMLRDELHRETGASRPAPPALEVPRKKGVRARAKMRPRKPRKSTPYTGDDRPAVS